MKKDHVTSTNCAYIGLGYFTSRPYLWFGPLVAALFAFLLLISVFMSVTYLSWPTEVVSWLSYTWGIFKALGYAFISILLLWVSLFPIILNVAFEKMCGRILHEEKREVKSEGLGQAMGSSIHVIFRTFGWRISWPLIALASLFITGPLAIIVTQIGIGHIAMIDGCDLALSVQGVKGGERIQMLKAHSKQLLIAGIFSGLLSVALTATIIGWLFWLPGIYTGAVLWTMNWERPISKALKRD